VALGPVAKVSHSTSSLIKHLASHSRIAERTLEFLRIYELNMDQSFMKVVCGYLPWVCEDLTVKLSAKSIDDVNEERFKVYIGGHFPSGSSTKCHYHYGQLIVSDTFSEYSYGSRKNMEVYGQTKPPEIDLKPVPGVPIAMFVGEEDDLADVTDARWLRNQTDSEVVHYEEMPKMGHISFLIAKDMTYFSDRVISLLNKYSN